MVKRRRAMKGSAGARSSAKGAGAPRAHRHTRLVRRKAPLPFQRFVAQDTPTARKIALIRAGVAARVVNEMVAYLQVPKGVVFAVLHMPESTAHKLIKDNRTLDRAASERVVRVADITRMAQETFSGREPATQWLKTANLALAGAAPLSMLDTEPGAGEVRRLLQAISAGGVM